MISSNNKPVVALQQHYTSSQYGLSGHPGFQIRAQSDGIAEEEQRELTRLGMYNPPRNLPSTPSPEEVEELFPIAYHSSVLKNGQLAIIRSVYVGQDYTKRYGNFFAHSLIFESIPYGIWPVDLYEWSGWKNKLDEGEDRQDDKTGFNLPKVVFEPNLDTFSLMELRVFLRNDSGRREHLAKMIRAIMLRAKNSRNLIIREAFETNAPFWIACIQKSFPSNYQKKISCSSYQFDPRSSLAVNVVLGETDFNIGENERKFLYYVFDFIGGMHSEVEDVGNEYAHVISTWMCNEPEKLRDFHNFSHKFEYETPDDELVLLLRIFRLSIGDSFSMNEDSIMEILAFINKKTKAEDLADVIQIISTKINNLSGSNDPDYLNHLFCFLLNSVKLTNHEKHKDAALRLFLDMLDKNIFYKTFPEELLKSLRAKAREVIPQFDQKIGKRFISSEQLEKIYSRLGQIENQGLSKILKEFVQAIQNQPGTGPLLSEPSLIDFIQNILKSKIPNLSELDWLFEEFDGSVNDVTQICGLICKFIDDTVNSKTIQDNTRKQILDSFIAYTQIFFEKKGSAFRFSVLNQLKLESVNFFFLEKEWCRTVLKNKKILLVHNEYYKNLLSDNSQYAQKFKNEFAQKVWNNLPAKDRLKQSILWIRDDHIAYITKPLLDDIFQKALEGISFKLDDKSSDDLGLLLSKKANEYGITLLPNIPLLRLSLIHVYRSRDGFNAFPFGQISESLSTISSKTYSLYVNSYLPKSLNKVESSTQHGIVLKSIYMQKHKNAFMKAYHKFFKNCNDHQFSNSEIAALKFWISFNENDPEYSFFNSINEDTRRFLVERISKLKNDSLKTLISISKKRWNLSQEQKEKLDNIYKDIQDNKKSFLQRVVCKGSEGLQKIRSIFDRSKKNV